MNCPRNWHQHRGSGVRPHISHSASKRETVVEFIEMGFGIIKAIYLSFDASHLMLMCLLISLIALSKALEHAHQKDLERQRKWLKQWYALCPHQTD